jgi:UDP:flavonoid glycosyltransferase YjiC (YdhE family)
MFADPVPGRVRDLLDPTADWRPDIVVREIYELAGMYVQANLQVLHGLGTHDPNFTLLQEHALAQLRSTLGEPAWRVPMTDTTYIDPIPPALQPPVRQPFTKIIGVRTGPGEVRPGDVLPDRILTLPQERTVYLTLGTVFNTPAEFAVPLEALCQLPVNVVVTCGSGADPVEFEPLPPTVVVEQYVSQAMLLPRCSAVICHGGAGTVIGALGQGIPLVCLPRGADQFANAEQVARVGAGITLPPDQVLVESVSNATQRILDDSSYAAVARRLRSDIERLPDPSAVVAELTRAAA